LGSIQRNGGFKGDNLKTYGGTSDPRILLTPGEIYVSLKDVTQSADLLGAVARVPPEIALGRLTQDTVKLAFREGAPADLIYWVLRSPQYRSFCRSYATGTTNLGLPREDFLAYPIPDETPYRCQLVAALNGLDNKIELNRRMNKTLEAMARAIFKDWFVDFGPTRAKMEGRAPYLGPDLWSLFPARLDGDGKPEGWSEKPLDQIADFLNGLALQKYPARDGASLPVIKIAQLRAGNTASADRASTDVPPDYVVEDGDVLFSWSGSLLHRVWTGGRGALNQHLFKVTSSTVPKWFFFLWIAEHMPGFQAVAASKATTMGHIQRHHLTQAATLVGDPAIMKAADALIGPLFGRQVANDLESRTLAATRDLLLPKLMSGEVRVKDAERFAQGAA
jgi:type I restriction enzyme S subunit